MANTDLNQLFNNLIPMLLQASRQRKTDDLKERQFQLQQRQGAQDRAFRLKEFEDRNADQLRNEATEADKHKGESYAKLNNDGKLSWINSKVSLPSGFDEATERARIKEEQIEEDRQQTIEDDYNRARIRYTDAEADAIIERNRLSKLTPKERTGEFRRTILQQQMNMAALQDDMELYDKLEQQYLKVGVDVPDVPEGVGDLDIPVPPEQTEAERIAEQNRSKLKSAIGQSPATTLFKNIFKNVQVGGRDSKLIF